jgi:hypothetical protein
MFQEGCDVGHEILQPLALSFHLRCSLFGMQIEFLPEEIWLRISLFTPVDELNVLINVSFFVCQRAFEYGALILDVSYRPVAHFAII